MTADEGGITPPIMPHFSVLGYHSTIYDVALPPILPQDVHDKMISRYRGYLCNQLRQLAQPANDMKTHPSPLSCSQEERAVFGDDSGSEMDLASHDSVSNNLESLADYLTYV